MAVKKVEVPDIGTVHLHKRKGTRGLRLSVGHNGEIRVSLPAWVPYRTALEFAMSKRAWIKSQQMAPEILREGSHIGKAHRMSFVSEATRHTIATRLTSSGEIRIYIPAHLPVEHPDVQKAAHRASVRALKQQAEKLLPQRLRTLAIEHDFSYRNVSIKQLKSRWGSCSDQRDIALNCFLMQLPWHLIDYVLLHELVHTRVMTHGPKFWNELSAYIPNLKAVRKEIKTYRPVLLTQ